jgi:hypothetical protein
MDGLQMGVGVPVHSQGIPPELDPTSGITGESLHKPHLRHLGRADQRQGSRASLGESKMLQPPLLTQFRQQRRELDAAPWLGRSRRRKTGPSPQATIRHETACSEAVEFIGLQVGPLLRVTTCIYTKIIKATYALANPLRLELQI